MFQHMAIVRLDPLVCEKNTFCNALLILQLLVGGGERDLVLKVWGFWRVLDMSNTCCWSASMASSGSVVGPVLVGWSMCTLVSFLIISK
jgi:hypothetical protein